MFPLRYGPEILPIPPTIRQHAGNVAWLEEHGRAALAEYRALHPPGVRSTASIRFCLTMFRNPETGALFGRAPRWYWDDQERARTRALARLRPNDFAVRRGFVSEEMIRKARRAVAHWDAEERWGRSPSCHPNPEGEASSEEPVAAARTSRRPHRKGRSRSGV